MMLSVFWPFYQFLWTVFFFTMFLVGFWCIFMFFMVVVPVWLSEGLMEYYGKTQPFDPEELRRKEITEQEGVEIIYSRPKGHGPFAHGGHH
ncbi:MAG: hypothetical protein FDW93_04500 [Bergeyella sp.]|nr:hypothetical protein [Bergeyella sp.]